MQHACMHMHVHAHILNTVWSNILTGENFGRMNFIYQYFAHPDSPK